MNNKTLLIAFFVLLCTNYAFSQDNLIRNWTPDYSLLQDFPLEQVSTPLNSMIGNTFPSLEKNLAQSNSLQDVSSIYKWKIGLKLSENLIWGDVMSSDNPLKRMTGIEASPSYGIDLTRKLGRVLFIQGAVNYGNMKGLRSDWKGSLTHPTITSETSFLDYSLSLGMDFTALFGFKEDRRISLYGNAGFGQIHYKSTSFADGNLFKTVDAKSYMVPWGIGGSVRIGERGEIFAQTMFMHTKSDTLDAYAGSGTDIADIYSSTSIGFRYKFNMLTRDKTPQLPEEEEYIEPVIAKAKPLVTHVSDLPKEIVSDSVYLVKTIIATDSISGVATYTLSLPTNTSVKDIEVQNASIEIDKQKGKVIFTWDSIPNTPIAIAYALVTEDTLDINNNIFKTSFEYTKDGKYAMNMFNTRLNIVNKPPKIVLEDTTEVVPVDIPIQFDLTYRIQVMALSQDKSSEVVKDYLNLDEKVYRIDDVGIYRYMVGEFATYKEALIHLKTINVKGAYVVVTKGDEYKMYLYEINDVIADKSGVLPTPPTYKVQIAASYSRPYSIAKLAYKYNVETSQITEISTSSGWYKYSLGTFSIKEEAKSYLIEIRKINSQSYIVKIE